MKVYIGPYKDWIGPYQIAEKILFWLDKNKDDRVHEFGTWLAGGESEKSLLSKFCNWFHSKKERAVSIRIDNYDTWNMDSTLALIILPMLKQLRETKHGSPSVDDKDVPKELRSTAAPAKKHEYDTDENHFKRWDWVLDEMIWAFEQKHPDYDCDQQFYSGNMDTVWIPSKQLDEKGKPLTYEMTKGPNDTYKVDTKGLHKHYARMTRGFTLFGKYYQGLWD